MISLMITLPFASAHAYHLQLENDDDTGGTDSLGSNNWIAQSFIAETPFTIARVSLLVEDNGPSAILIASLRNDASGFPATTDLTSGTGDGPSLQTWVDVDFGTWVDLEENETYWIVTRATRPTAWGYDWYHSPDDSTYPNGTGASSPDGSSWSPEFKDYTFRLYGYFRPHMTYDVIPSATTLEPGDTGKFRINLNNSGPGDAEGIWVNLTLPAELAYFSDDSADLGGLMSCCYSYQFSNLTPGSHSFNVSFVVNGGIPDGTPAVTSLTFDSSDHAAYSPPTELREITVTISSGNLSTSISTGQPFVDPGDILQTDLGLENRGNGSALNVQVDTRLDSNATYSSSSPTGTYDVGNHTVRWSIPLLGPGSNLTLAWIVQVKVGVPNGASVASTADVTYEDASGFRLPTIRSSVQSTVQAPSFSPSLIVDRSTVERGDEILATAFYNNTGSVLAPNAWLNWSLGGNFEVTEVSPELPYSETPGWISFALSNVTPGPHSLAVRLRTIRGLADGEDIGIRVTWEARDGNGNTLATSTLPAVIILNSPEVILNLESSATQLEVGEVLILNITMNNLGMAPAVGWLNLTTPDGFVYAGTDSGAYEASVGGSVVSWTIAELSPKSAVTLGVRLHLVEARGLTSLRFSLTYTDGKGSPAVTVNSNAVFVEPVPVGPRFEEVALWAIVAAFTITAAFLVILRLLRTGKLSIEEVFVIHRDGILLAHRSKTLTPDKDQDVLVAMLKTVQDFIRDAFSSREDAPVRSLMFGEFNILIERGLHHHVAVVYRGIDSGALSARLKSLSRRIDRDFGQTLDTWSGDMDAIRGLRDLLPLLWGPRAGVAKGEPGDEEPDRVKASILQAWNWARGMGQGVWKRLRSGAPHETAEIEATANGGWERG